MNADFAALVASGGRDLASRFAEGLVSESEELISRSPASDAPEGAPPAEEDSDRVTIQGRSAKPTGVDVAGLQGLFGRMRRGGAASPAAVSASSSSLLSASFSSFSLKATFANTRAAQLGGAGFEQTLGDIEGGLSQLFSMAPGEAKRLSVLLRSLAALDPDNADAMLRQVSRALDVLGKIGAPGPGASAPADAPPPAQAPSQGPPPAEGGEAAAMVEMVHFELHFEMEMTSEVRASLAEIRNEGIAVQTIQATESRKVSIHIEYTALRVQKKQADPLVLDLGGDGVHLTGKNNGAAFDINADGRADRTAFVQGDDAFLALDRNGNGRIDNGSELFGDQNGAANGYAELKRFDENGDGRIDADDGIFDSLRLLHDRDGNGQVRIDELSSLAEQNIASIDLAHRADRGQRDPHGNRLAESGYFTRTDGSRGRSVDVWLGYE